MKRSFWLIPVILLALYGCSSPPVEVNRFDPVAGGPFISTLDKNGEIYASYIDPEIQLVTTLYEYNSIIVMPLTIVNRTDHDIGPADYSLSLCDGRDFKPVRMLDRNDLVNVKGKLEGKGTDFGSGIEGMALAATVNAFEDLTNQPSTKMMVKGINQAINDYFEFRPVYASEARTGLLCFLVDFKLEYPLTVRLKVKDKLIDIRFLPRPKKEGN
ncbi:MAG: hypothetical protein JW782_03115 [Candidatus Saganbacteria bacterium]|nr:hypothetical protein [Candidatus Saganbacteria bacterium]